MTTIDWVVGGLVAIIGLFILYKAIQEPIDMLLDLIKRGLIAVKDWLFGIDAQRGYDQITYG